MSIVYRGLDTRLDRPVAVKVMDPRFAGDRSFLERFIREARATARLRHPAAVGVHDQGVDRDGPEDRVFLVMELVDGGTLRDLLDDQGELPVPLALSVLDPVLSALAAAHREGLVHRDIKPENVLIGRGGEVKVADFGLVRAVAEAGSTSDSVILGTVAYLSPEQVATGAADARSDVYSAGIVLFEMLTGAPPYSGDTALSVAYRHVNDDVPAPGSVLPGIAPALDHLVLRATRRDPDERPANAAAFLLALQQVRSQLGIRRVHVPVPILAAAEDDGPTVPARMPGRMTAGDGATLRPPNGAHDQGRPPVPPHQSVRPVIHHPPAGAHGPQGTRAYSRVASAGVAPPHPADPYLVERARDRRTFLIWTAIVLVLAVLIGYGAWHLAVGRWTAVPQLEGLDRDQVELALREAGLDPRVVDDHSDVVPAGQLVSIEPVPGAKVLRGRDVRVVLSEGRPRVPELTGLLFEQARTALAAEDLRLHHAPDADRYDEQVPEGGVLHVNPPTGTELAVGTPVELVLSRGPPPVDVPDVRGRTLDEAAAALAGVGLRVAAVSRERFDGEVPGGRVAGTDPPSGHSARKGAEVTLELSNALVVPDVLGKPRAEALAALDQAGFVTVEAGEGTGDDNARVVRTDPETAALVDPAANGVTIQLEYQVTVPRLVGLRVDEARETLAKLGLRAEVNQLFGGGSSRVYGQSPGAGSRLEPGSVVQLSAL